MCTVIDFQHHHTFDRHLRWDRYERADVFGHYLKVQAQGVSERQAAKRLHVPRTTLHAWRNWQDTLDICLHVAPFLQSEPGLAFLHRLVLALHRVCVEVGACGMRLVCLLLNLTGLDRFVAASSGAQQQVNHRVEQAMVDYRRVETPRLAKDMPPKDITVTQDDTCTGGLCLVGMEPVSNFMIFERLAGSREQATWNELMAPALAELNGQVIQSTSDEASGLLAYVEHHLEAHHSPDVFHVQQERSRAVSAPMATKVRAAHKAASEAQAQLELAQSRLQIATDEPPKRGPGRPPKDPMSPEQAQQALDAASREHERLARQREQVKQSIRAIGHAYHFVDLERGVRRNGPLIAADIQTQIETIRTLALHEGLSQSSLDRIDKAQRVVPKMQGTIEFVSGSVGQQVAALDLTPPVSHAMHARLIPSYSLEWVSQTQTVTEGEPLRDLAGRLRTLLCEADGV